MLERLTSIILLTNPEYEPLGHLDAVIIFARRPAEINFEKRQSTRFNCFAVYNISIGVDFVAVTHCPVKASSFSRQHVI